MKNIFSLFLVVFPGLAQAQQLKCEYGFMGSPMGSVAMTLDETGRPGEYATVSLFFSPARQMPVTIEVPAAGELLRLILSKDDPSNEVHLTVFEDYKSKLVNPAAPVGKELQGACTLL
ncbi:hypothetical protein QJS83_03410 [Bdellovibrio sp. 22V]|uniref:hypothetical protein n=1 Tax=Bdellovibrio TaxID=958 RepID=UPI00254313CC|nr:hypothetical protein [Bdellovibrio sp. 22V]WII72918.1 hypothetical protein QJS83_03410 [Bdellovibrio sp. 22V]